MSRNLVLANATLWATAILAGALLGAPRSLTLGLLPSLAAISWLATPRAGAPACRRRP